MSLYDDLGVPKDADSAAIKRAYRKRAHRAHPDKGGSAEKFHAIQVAYTVLSDEAKRAHYDRTGEAKGGVEDSLESRAMRELGTAIVQAVENCPDLENMNIVKDIMDAVRGRIEKERGDIRTFHKRIERYKGAAKRVKRKKRGANILAGMVEANIVAFRRGIEMSEENIKLDEAMLKLLEEYDYETDKGVPAPSFGTSVFMSFSR